MKTGKNLKKRLLGEAAIYGLLSVIYGSLFFFGALYPRYGLSAACVEESAEDDGTEEDGMDGKTGIKRENKTEGKGEDSENGEIVYKSFFLECLKEWF